MQKEDLFILGTSPKGEGGVYITSDFIWKSHRHYSEPSQNSQFHLNQEDADKYMDAVIRCIEIVSGIVEKLKVSYEPKDIVAFNLARIEAWTCPINLMSKFSIEEVAQNSYERYVNKVKKETEEIELLIKKRKENADSLSIKEEESLLILNKNLNYGLSENMLKTRFDKYLEKTGNLLNEIKNILDNNKEGDK